MDDNNSPPSIKKSDTDPDTYDGHLTISQMAEKFDVTYRALRFYQQKGLLSPKRKGTTRLYRPRDIAHMTIIMGAKRTGISLSDVQDVLSAYHHNGSDHQNQIIIEKLKYQENFLTKQSQQISEQLEETRRLLAESKHLDQKI